MRPVEPESTARSTREPTFLSCTVELTGREAAWLRVGGELDLATSWYVAEQLDRLFTGARLVVADLCDLTFMDAVGLAVLIGADARARSQACRLVIVRVPAQVQRLLQISRVAEHLQISQDAFILAL